MGGDLGRLVWLLGARGGPIEYAREDGRLKKGGKGDRRGRKERGKLGNPEEEKDNKKKERRGVGIESQECFSFLFHFRKKEQKRRRRRRRTKKNRTSSGGKVILCLCWDLLLLPGFEHKTLRLLGVLNVLQSIAVYRERERGQGRWL